ncbi:MAG: DUF4209 domain-containing protein [Planctomycetaceae bacterium]|nr:DUF4209 domain-containing protein [Planctomycetaceae bacterium]
MVNEIEKVLSAFENATDPFDEHEVSEAVRKLRKKDDKSEPPMEWLAEYTAFDFYEDGSEQGSVWGIYFGPMMSGKDKDGTTWEIPSLNQVTPEILDYWYNRAKQAKHPILKTRYATLVWEFSKHVTNKPADITMAHICIDSVIEMAKLLCHKYESNVIRKIKYATKLAISINDKIRSNQLRDTMIDFEGKIADDSKRGLWGFSFDTLLMNKKIKLVDEQAKNIIDDLETRLDRVSNFDNKESFDPFAAESAAIRLAQYYRKQNNPDDIKRALLKYGGAFEKISKEASGLLAITWLQKVESIYRDFGLKDEADKLLNIIHNRGPDAHKDMKPISVKTEIPREEMDNYVNAMTAGEIDKVMTMIVIQYIPNKSETQKELKNTSKNFPLSFLFSNALQDHNGRTIANIGSLEEDIDGHIIMQIAQDMQFISIFLRNVLHKFKEKFSISSDSIIGKLSESPVFTKEKMNIVKRGLDAYFNEDHLVAIHLLIPQVEDAIRKLLELAGGTISKQNRYGGYDYKTFNEILRDDVIVQLLGEDAVLYFRVLYTDPRGWNLRNNVCHGISLPNQFCVQITDRIFHSLLFLGLIRERKE